MITELHNFLYMLNKTKSSTFLTSYYTQRSIRRTQSSIYDGFFQQKLLTIAKILHHRCLTGLSLPV